MQMNNRREFLIALGSAIAATRSADAQQTGRTFRVGWLDATVGRTEPYQVAFIVRLRDMGFVEGRNLVIEFRSTEGRNERIPEVVADLARQNCDVLLVPATEAALVAIKQATRDTPIVAIANDYDPVTTGHVASLARPGGRITGISQMQTDLPAKRLELLKELLPKARKIGVFADSATAGQLAAVRAAANLLSLTLQVHEFTRAPYDYEGAFAEMARAKAEALLVLASGNFVPARRQIPAMALKNRLPSMFGNYLWAEAGALLSYGPNFTEFYRRAAEQVVKILKGAKPADIPVEQPTLFEMVLNLKTAKALGITIPQSIAVRADKVVE